MCGITGIYSYADSASPVDRAELLRMREHMMQRGPDGAGLWVADDQRVGLAHRRLAIIDLTADGAQPMATADGRFQIVFNGEIYNYLELRTQLQSQGVLFKSQTDTEVLLQLYARHGAAMCSQLRGMYAFAIWDTLEQSLFLARDPFGIKPLYIADDGHTLRFASQVKALLAGGAVPSDRDPQGEYGYWVWGHVPEPHTLYAAISAFKPGTWLKIARNGQVQDGQFDSVADMLQGDTPPAIPYADLRAALLDSVGHHLIADVPVGVFLSSGIDSATLAALAAECGGKLRTVTLGFEEYRGTEADESPMAEEVARQYGADHQTVWIGKQDFEHAFEEFIDAMDQPSADGLNTWLVSRAASQLGLKVAISGLGGDEFFGGYPSFQQIPKIRRLASHFAAIPGLGKMVRQLSAPVLRRFTTEKYAGLLEYGSTLQGAYQLRRAMRMPWELDCKKTKTNLDCNYSEQGVHEYVDPVSRRVIQSSASEDFAQISHLEATQYMRNQLLRDSDWASMAHSIELRVPLVDVALTQFIAAQRLGGYQYTKQDLAAAANPALPTKLTNRPKTGFTVPVRDWMKPTNSAQTKQAERGLRGWQRSVLGAYQGVQA
ncbi:MAG: asparagine synthase (glutamine-hydrolyzing) [Comamonadaceae bacterium PBBC1]|nr:MAG: asparagine synthase (glutamine-hydrolyzing) [Comamonadaceae bacterium PBBC1]